MVDRIELKTINGHTVAIETDDKEFIDQVLGMSIIEENARFNLAKLLEDKEFKKKYDELREHYLKTRKMNRLDKIMGTHDMKKINEMCNSIEIAFLKGDLDKVASLLISLAVETGKLNLY